MTLRPTQHKESKEEYLSLWQQRLDSLMYSLKRAALENEIAVVVVDHTDETIPDYPFGQTQLPTAENIILHAITHRLDFKNHDGYKVARIVHSSCYPEGEVPFTIGVEGFTDIHQ